LDYQKYDEPQEYLRVRITSSFAYYSLTGIVITDSMLFFNSSLCDMTKSLMRYKKFISLHSKLNYFKLKKGVKI